MIVLGVYFNIITVELKGYGRSDRVKIHCKNYEQAETEFIDALENWRSEMVSQGNLSSSFILVGHSMYVYRKLFNLHIIFKCIFFIFHVFQYTIFSSSILP